MVALRSAGRDLFRRAACSLLSVALAYGVFAPTEASARHYRAAYYRHYAFRPRAFWPRPVFARRAFRPAHFGGGFVPPFSAYAVDGNSGRVLYARDENATRHPASLTKVMTLYLLFEQLEKGHLTFDTRIDVSPHAAAQSPTKLGLRAGSSIRVEDAIKAIVTESANDMAVAVAEKIGGDEDNFARMMTRKAHSLGMSRSNFVNASGLPDDMQLTTAHDMAVLGRAIHDHYPNYFHFFSTPSFRYAGRFMANHNHLMSQVEGMDGIKTGYTRSSGFNLLSSVNRDGHWLVSVVLGGRTRLGRDKIMADLIASEIDKCSKTRTALAITENPALENVAEALPATHHDSAADSAAGSESEEVAEEQPAVTEDKTAGNASESDDSTPTPMPRPVPAKLEPAPVKVAALDTDVTPRPRPAFVSGTPHQGDRDMTSTGSIQPHSRFDGSTSRYAGATTATPPTLRHSAHRDRGDSTEKAAPIKVASLDASPAVTGRPARTGWMIQIGATETIAQANELLSRAKGESRGTLARATPFTEKVGKGGGTLYRARFAGLESDRAEAACKSLKRVGFSCFTTRN